MVTTDNDELAEKLRVISLHGMSRNAWNRYSATGSWFYEILYPGYKCNMTDIQASLGLTQLAKLNRLQARREEIVNKYNKAFAEIPSIIEPRVMSYGRAAWHLYVIRVQNDLMTIDRNQFIEELKKANIGTSVHFIPVHLHPYYRDRFGFKRGDLPKAEKVYDEVISLPLYPKMSDLDVNDVIEAVQGIASDFAR